MEFDNKKQGGGGGGGGFMKGKLVMSLYRAAKPSYGEHATKVEQEASWAVLHKVSMSSKPAAGGGGGGIPSWDDGYVHGPRGVSGDEQVDTKATSYIWQVKERRRLEEQNIMDEGLPL